MRCIVLLKNKDEEEKCKRWGYKYPTKFLFRFGKNRIEKIDINENKAKLKIERIQLKEKFEQTYIT